MIHIPISVAKATVDTEVKFDRIGPDGGEIGRREYDKNSGDVVQSDDIQKGIRNGNEFHVIPGEEITKIDRATKLENIEIQEFVDRGSVPIERITGAYYVQTRLKEGNVLALQALTVALMRTDKAAIAKWVSSKKQKLVVIWPRDDGALVMNTLSFRASWQEPDDQVLMHMVEGKVSKKLLDEAVKVVKENSGDGASIELSYDERQVLFKDLIEKALEGETIEIPDTTFVNEVQHNEDGLLAALQATSEVSKKTKKTQSKTERKPKSTSTKKKTLTKK